MSASPSTADFGAIEHATGAADILLRYEEGGGFMAPSFTVAQTPIFTLYGDGTIVFRNPMLEGPAPDGSVFRLNPLRTAKLSEDQIQDLLAYALGEGSLGIARAQYDFGGVADASTGTFTVNAGGIKKSVAVYALGMDTPDVPDAAATGGLQAPRRSTGRLRSGRRDPDGRVCAGGVPRDPDGRHRDGRPGCPDVGVEDDRPDRLQGPGRPERLPGRDSYAHAGRGRRDQGSRTRGRILRTDRQRSGRQGVLTRRPAAAARRDGVTDAGLRVTDRVSPLRRTARRHS